MYHHKQDQKAVAAYNYSNEDFNELLDVWCACWGTIVVRLDGNNYISAEPVVSK